MPLGLGTYLLGVAPVLSLAGFAWPGPAAPRRRRPPPAAAPAGPGRLPAGRAPGALPRGLRLARRGEPAPPARPRARRRPGWARRDSAGPRPAGRGPGDPRNGGAVR